MLEYQVSFVLIRRNDNFVFSRWTSSELFCTKASAMEFAQNTSRAFNGSDYKLYYRVIA